jgi:predicted metal-binding protein
MNFKKIVIKLVISCCIFFKLANIATAQNVSFESDILPIFELKCGECHGEVYPELRLTLTSYEGILKGSEYGSVVKPGDPSASYLIDMIASGEMPQDGEPVNLEEFNLIRSWIEQGALEN